MKRKIKSFTLTVITLMLMGCYSSWEPGSSVTQSGDGVYNGSTSELELKKIVVNTCEIRNCSKFEIRGNQNLTELDIDMYITTNDTLSVQKFSNNRARIHFSQRDMLKPSIKTILVLRDLKDLGFDIKYIGGEKWHCDGKPLKKRYCRQETTQGHGQDFLDYIVQDNNMKFEYKDGDKTIQL